MTASPKEDGVDDLSNTIVGQGFPSSSLQSIVAFNSRESFSEAKVTR